MFSPDSLKVNRPVLDLITVLDIAMFRENADMIRADHDRRGISHDSVSYTHLTLPTTPYV